MYLVHVFFREQQFRADEKTQDAVIYSLAVISEAVAQRQALPPRVAFWRLHGLRRGPACWTVPASGHDLSPERSNSMQVHPKDGRCRACGGTLTIIDADDDTMTVECANPECCECYAVETDAFGDGAMHY